MLGEVRARLGQARGLRRRRPRRGRRAGLLSALDQHPEPLVPPELRRAGDELERGLRLISGGADAVADIGARL